MRPSHALVALLWVFTAFATSGCDAAASGEESDRPAVVVTTNVLGDIAQNVLGGVADVEWIMPRGASPHVFDISAAQVERMYEADLVISNGPGPRAGHRLGAGSGET